MKLILLAVGTLLAMPLTGLAQGITVSSQCSPGAAVPDNTVLMICTHERGMAPRLQPRQYLRLFADGLVQYEVDPPMENRAEQTKFVLVIKEFRLSRVEEIDFIRRLGRSAEFQAAPAEFPTLRRGIDSSMETTVRFFDRGQEKRIVLNNFSTFDWDNKKRYPAPLFELMERAELLREKAMGIVRPIPAITFCEMMKNREYYFGRTVNIYADLEFNERQLYLHDPECDTAAMGEARTTERIAVGYTPDPDKNLPMFETIAYPIRWAWGGRARVFVTGVLRDESKLPNFAYSYRFEIAEFKSVERIVLPYEGTLEVGWFYSDTFDHVAQNGLQLSSRLTPIPHHAARIEWANAISYPLVNKSGRRHIIFRVVSKETTRISNNRWNDEYTCEIVELK
jgi:hypothetical protein